MKRRFVDIHHHILYAMDDGAQNRKQMHAMLRSAAANEIGTIVATPHVTPGVKYFDREQYQKSLREANAYCASKELDLKLYEGAEILYTDQTGAFLEDGRIPSMAGTNRILVEFSPDIKYEKLCSALERIGSAGYIPLIAHAERYHCLTRKPDRAIEIKDDLKALLQINCSSVVNASGYYQKHFISRMLSDEMIDAIATDAHNRTSRSVNMYEAWEIIREEYGAAYAKRLTNGSVLDES